MTTALLLKRSAATAGRRSGEEVKKEVQLQSDEARVLAAVAQRRMVAAVLLRLDQHGCQAEPTLCSGAATLTGHDCGGF